MLSRVLPLLALVAALGWGAASSRADERLRAPVLSDASARTFLFTLPAVRGTVTDRHGQVLARTLPAQRAVLQFAPLGEVSEEQAVEAGLQILEGWPVRDTLLPEMDVNRLRHHWRHRPLLPLPLTGFLTETQIGKLKAAGLGPLVALQNEHVREYPEGRLACHVIGYVSRDAPAPSGPVHSLEPLWAPVEGCSGIERGLDRELTGRDGVLCVVFHDQGRLRRDQLVRPPVPGSTVALTLDARLQRLAERVLARNGRPGALVAMQPATGEILALASHPGFDLSAFVPSISPERLKTIQDMPGSPFFCRATSGQYPPGSTFKPIVALAALNREVVTPSTRYACRPSMQVAGRTFRNWNPSEFGYYNASDALMRSCNTWFYRAALETGGPALLEYARAFGIGQAPDLPLEHVASGNLPEHLVAGRAIANFSIGQGELLVSPLQLAAVMAALADGKALPRPRLVRGESGAASPAEKSPLPVTASDIAAVHEGMWRVVNDSGGTGQKAALGWPTVYGKTGTAEWYQQHRKRHLAWFAGFAGSGRQQLAYAILCEGRRGESLYGGRVVAPMAAQFLAAAYEAPETFSVEPVSSKGAEPSR